MVILDMRALDRKNEDGKTICDIPKLVKAEVRARTNLEPNSALAEWQKSPQGHQREAQETSGSAFPTKPLVLKSDDRS